MHVVERVETYDRISRNRFVTRYAYHHGYFDGVEREFRGFGMVEQWDTEQFGALSAKSSLPSPSNVDVASHVPPAHTRTWFHTGVYLEGEHVSLQYEREYLPEARLIPEAFRDQPLPDTILPEGLAPDEEHEACRSLRGSILRQEVYADDKSARAEIPYSVSERNYTIEVLQKRGANRHAVFFTHPRETITYNYERELTDPRVQHEIVLKVDAFGNVERSCAVGYERRDVPGRLPEQKATHATLTLNRFANESERPDWYRIGLAVESCTYELVKPPTPGHCYDFDELCALINALCRRGKTAGRRETIPYEQWDWRRRWDQHAEPGGKATTRLRLIEHVCTLYRKDNLSGACPPGTIESLALPYETYKLAFTPALVAQVYQRLHVGQPPESLLPDTAGVLGSAGSDGGGYVDLDGDGSWCIPSGRIFYSRRQDSAAIELAFARQHFFLPHRFCDPFGQDTLVTYDGDPLDPQRNHNLLPIETSDFLGNIFTASTEDDAGHRALRLDYRVLQPYWLTDPNRNRTQVAFDALGMVVATAVMGKPRQNKGDNLQDYQADLPRARVADLLAAGDPHALAPALLGAASTRILYDLHCFRLSQQANPNDPTQWQPTYTATMVRETHASDPLPPHGLKIQISFSYSDGFGREIQKKVQAEPGQVEVEDAGGAISIVDTTTRLRWAASGWTIFNNKGKPVRQYEPFFSTTQRFQFGKTVGVSPILFYDPLERVIVTLHPNHTYDKIIFDPWQQATYDVNDTVAAQDRETGDPRTDPDIAGFVKEYFKTQPTAWQTWYTQRIAGQMGDAECDAARKAAAHASTPTVAHLDSLGRTCLTRADNGPDPAQPGQHRLLATRIEMDIEGNQREVIDAKGRVVMRYDYDMLGNRIHQASIDAGERWMLNDVAARPSAPGIAAAPPAA